LYIEIHLTMLSYIRYGKEETEPTLRPIEPVM